MNNQYGAQVRLVRHNHVELHCFGLNISADVYAQAWADEDARARETGVGKFLAAICPARLSLTAGATVYARFMTIFQVRRRQLQEVICDFRFEQ